MYHRSEKSTIYKGNNRPTTTTPHTHPSIHPSQVWGYWAAKRQRFKKPLLRRFWPITSINDTNPHLVFRPREKERYVRACVRGIDRFRFFDHHSYPYTHQNKYGRSTHSPTPNPPQTPSATITHPFTPPPKHPPQPATSSAGTARTTGRRTGGWSSSNGTSSRCRTCSCSCGSGAWPCMWAFIGVVCLWMCVRGHVVCL